MFALKKIRTIMTRMYDQNVRTYKSVHTLLAKLLNNIDCSENMVGGWDRKDSLSNCYI